MGRRLQLLLIWIIPTSAPTASNLKSSRVGLSSRKLSGAQLRWEEPGASVFKPKGSSERLLSRSVLVCSTSCDHRGLNLRGSAATVSGYLSGNCGRDGRGGEDGSRSARVCRLAGELTDDRGDTAEQAETHFLQDRFKLEDVTWLDLTCVRGGAVDQGDVRPVLPGRLGAPQLLPELEPPGARRRELGSRGTGGWRRPGGAGGAAAPRKQG